MRIVKLFAVATVSILLIVIVVGIVLILRFDPNDYKPQITALVEERTGRTLRIDEDIEWTLFPWLAIGTGGITLGNHPEFTDTDFATIESVSARVRVLPLLRREIQLGEITIDGIVLDLGTNADGTANWSDLMPEDVAGGATGAEPEQRSAGSAMEDLRIAGIRIGNGRVLWRESGEVRYVVSELNVESGAVALGEPVDLEAALKLLDVPTQRRVALNVTTTAATDGSEVQLSGLDAETLVTDAAGTERGRARLVTEAVRINSDGSIEAAAGSIDATATNLPVGAETLDARISWPALAITGAGESARVEDIVTEVGGIRATWTVDVDDLGASPNVRGQVRLDTAPASELLAILGISPPEGIDPDSLGDVAGGGAFTARASGEASLEDFTILVLGMSVNATASLAADSAVEATIDIPSFAPTAAFRDIAQEQLGDAASLDAIESLSLDLSLAASLTDGPVRIDGIDLAVNDARLTGSASLAGGGEPAAEHSGTLTLDMPDSALLAALAGEAWPANLDPAAVGSAILTAEFRYAAGRDTLSVESFDLAALGLGATGNLVANNLRSAPVVRGNGSLRSFDPREVLTRLEQPVPEVSDPNVFQTADFDGDFVIDSAHAEFSNMRLGLDDMQIRGSISVEDFESPSYRFDLRTNALDVDRYLPPSTDEADDDERVAGDIELASEPLELLALNGRARVGDLRIANLRFRQVDATLTIGDGRARIAPARARVYGGDFDGSLAVDTSTETPSMQLTGTATSVRLAPLIRALTGESTVTGTGSFELDLTGNGVTVTETLRSAAGTMNFALTEGTITGFNLGRTLCAAYNLREQLPQPADAAAETNYELIRATADVSDGIATSRDVLARTGFLDIDGSGGMALADARVDYDMRATLTAAVPIQGCETMTEFVGDSIPFTIDGPLSAPDIQPDYSEIVRDRVREEVRDRVEDRLRDRLRDLL